MKQTKIAINLVGLEELKAKVGDQYRARVGILGSHGARTAGEDGKPAVLDNATLGVIQMFGSITKGIPPRDFLDMPVRSHAREIVQAMGASSVKKAVAAGNFKRVYDLLGAAALNWVLMAFETAGFGQWPPNKPSTIARKKSDRPLIDTSQLRRAQTSDTVNRSEIV